MRVLVNGCRDRLRAAWRRRSVPQWGVPPAPEPEERQELEEIFSLPPADRAVIHLFYYEGLSTGEIARLTGQAEDRPVPTLPGPGPAQEIARRRNKMNQYKKYMDRQGYPRRSTPS